MRTRKEPTANYSSVFINGKTIRIPIDKTKTITELRYPEFLDVGINSKCAGGCTYCYTSATSKGYNFHNIVEKIHTFFGTLDMNQRPYQVALGGSGEPTLHDKFIEVLETFHSLSIVPNYTTNGMHLSDKVIDATKKYCGGVAITLHRHLEKFWRKGIETLIENGIKTNVHIVVSDKDSVDFLKQVYAEYNGRIDYFVLLPYMNVGFAENDPRSIDYTALEEWLDGVYQNGNIAFGSNFYEFLKTKREKYDVSIYPPEIMSKYLIMDDDMKVYNNSFECREVKIGA